MGDIKNRMKKIHWKHYVNYLVISCAIIVLAVLSMTGNVSMLTALLLEKIGISMILAVSLSLVVGFLGELSLGHAGFMCVGAYLGGKVASLLPEEIGQGVPGLLLALLVGGVCAAAFGLVIGLPALRLKGDYLAIVTLAAGEIVRVIFLNSSEETFGGTSGLETPRYDKETFFLIVLVLVLVTLFVIQNLIRSSHGRMITAVRDNEIAAHATGVNVTKYKLLAFAVSAFFAGVAGVLYSFSNTRVQYDVFDYNYSIEILVMVVLGGMGSINGSLIASALITFLNVELATVLTGDLAVLQNLLYALIMILLVIYNNAPALKGVREKYNMHTLWARLRKPKADPADVKDDSAAWARIPTKIQMDELLSVDLKVQGQEPDRDHTTRKGD